MSLYWGKEEVYFVEHQYLSCLTVHVLILIYPIICIGFMYWDEDFKFTHFSILFVIENSILYTHSLSVPKWLNI